MLLMLPVAHLAVVAPVAQPPQTRVAAVLAAPPGKLVQTGAHRPVPLEALRDDGERRYMGPGGTPRLVPVAPFNPKGEPIVFIHGFTGDPANQEVLIRAAQSRGMQVWTMAYDSVGFGAETNAEGFANEFQRIWGHQTQLTVVGHSLGALTFKAAMDRLTDPSGHLTNFGAIRLVAVAVPWGGIDLARPALQVRRDDPALAFARSLAPDSTFMMALGSRPMPPEVKLYNIAADRDPLALLPHSRQARRNQATIMAHAKRQVTVSGASHNTVLWDRRTIAFALEPEQSPDPSQTRRIPWVRTLMLETAAIFGVDGAFRGKAFQKKTQAAPTERKRPS
jgi:pimeloyl-ACP methyl ester carboxylesterase